MNLNHPGSIMEPTLSWRTDLREASGMTEPYKRAENLAVDAASQNTPSIPKYVNQIKYTIVDTANPKNHRPQPFKNVLYTNVPWNSKGTLLHKLEPAEKRHLGGLADREDIYAVFHEQSNRWLVFATATGASSPYLKSVRANVMIGSAQPWYYIRGGFDPQAETDFARSMLHYLHAVKANGLMDANAEIEPEYNQNFMTHALDSLEKAAKQTELKYAKAEELTRSIEKAGLKRFIHPMGADIDSGNYMFQLVDIPKNPPKDSLLSNYGAYSTGLADKIRDTGKNPGGSELKFFFTIDEHGMFGFPLSDHSNNAFEKANFNFLFQLSKFTSGGTDDILKLSATSDSTGLVRIDNTHRGNYHIQQVLGNLLTHAANTDWISHEAPIEALKNQINFQYSRAVTNQAAKDNGVPRNTFQDSYADAVDDAPPEVQHKLGMLKTILQAFRGKDDHGHIHASQYAHSGRRINEDWSLITVARIGDNNPLNRRGILIPKIDPNTDQKVEEDVRKAYGSKEYILSSAGTWDVGKWLLALDPKTKVADLKDLPPRILNIKMCDYQRARDRDVKATNTVDTYGEMPFHNTGTSGTFTIGTLAERFLGNGAPLSANKLAFLGNGVFKHPDAVKPKEYDGWVRGMPRVTKEKEFYEREQRIELTVDALRHAQKLTDFGAALRGAFPEGVNLTTNKVSIVVMFDEVGNMYRASHDDVQNRNMWQPLTPYMYKKDSPYRRVLQGISDMLKTGMPNYLSPDGFYGMTKNEHSAGTRVVMGQDKEFQYWFQDLNKKIEDSMEQKYVEQMSVLGAFPTLVFDTTGIAYFDDGNGKGSQGSTKLLSRAIDAAIDGTQKGTKAAQIAEEILRSATPRDRLMAPSQESVRNFTNFIDWLRVTYAERRGSQEQVFVGQDLLPVAEAKREIFKRVQEQVNHMHRALDAISSVGNSMMPAIMQADHIDDYQFTDSYLWNAKETVMNATVRPICNWITDTWDIVSTAGGVLFGMVWHWQDTIYSTCDYAVEGARMATKILFQVYATRVIEEKFKDHNHEVTGKRVRFGRVREFLKSFMSDGLGLKPLSTQDISQIQRITSKDAWVTARATQHGSNFRNAYEPRFVNNFAISQATGNKPENVMIVPEMNDSGKRPGLRFSVDVGIVHPEAVGLHPEYMTIINEKDTGTGIFLWGDHDAADKRKLVYDEELKHWFNVHRGQFALQRFDDKVRGAPKSLDNPQPILYTAHKGTEGAIHIRAHYTFGRTFGAQEARHAYASAYAFDLNSPNTTMHDRFPGESVGLRRVNLRETDQRKLYLVRRLFNL